MSKQQKSCAVQVCPPFHGMSCSVAFKSSPFVAATHNFWNSASAKCGQLTSNIPLTAHQASEAWEGFSLLSLSIFFFFFPAQIPKPIPNPIWQHKSQAESESLLLAALQHSSWSESRSGMSECQKAAAGGTGEACAWVRVPEGGGGGGEGGWNKTQLQLDCPFPNQHLFLIYAFVFHLKRAAPCSRGRACSRAPE